MRTSSQPCIFSYDLDGSHHSMAMGIDVKLRMGTEPEPHVETACINYREV